MCTVYCDPFFDTFLMFNWIKNQIKILKMINFVFMIFTRHKNRHILSSQISKSESYSESEWVSLIQVLFGLRKRCLNWSYTFEILLSDWLKRTFFIERKQMRDYSEREKLWKIRKIPKKLEKYFEMNEKPVIWRKIKLLTSGNGIIW